MGKPVFLRVLFFQDPHDSDTWIAQALEHDLVAFGRDIDQARHAFIRTLSGYITLAQRHHQKPFEILQPAPKLFWDIWTKETAERSLDGEPIPTIPGFMLQAVTHERLQATH